MNRMTALPIQQASHWEARLALKLARTLRGSVLKGCEHKGPLYVQKPFYPEGRNLAHLYLLHPPGGMVSGDTLTISADVGEQASALITTPGAGRVYKARADKSLQHQILRFDLADNASLEWLPLEGIIYPGAQTQLDTQVHLTGNARYIGWEITSLGLPACHQPFSPGSLMKQNLQIFRDGKLCLRERLVVDGDQQENGMLQSLAGLRGYPITAMMVAGPFDAPSFNAAINDDETALENLIRRLRDCCEQHKSLDEDFLAGVTLNHGFLMVRYLGHCSEKARKLFIECWKQVRPELLKRDICESRIWAT